MMLLRKVTLPNGKEVLFLGLNVYQRWPKQDDEWEKIDPAIFEHTPISRDAQVEEVIV